MALLATLVESEEHRSKAAMGVVSFGYFSLDKQRKVSRLRVREPDSKKRRVSDTLIYGINRLTA
jgi:hypothetical protein